MRRVDRRAWRTAAPLLAVVAWATPAALAGPWAEETSAQPLHDELASQVRETVERCARYARWCQKKKLYADRDATYALVLELDPEHKDARRYLRMRRGSDGVWAQSDSYRLGKNRNTKAVAESAERRREAVAPYREALLARLAAAREMRDVPVVEATSAVLVRVDPDAPEIHRALGELWSEEHASWLLEESVRSLAERRALVERLEAIAAGGEPTEVEPSDAEQKLGVDWTAAVATDHVRAVGSVERDVLVHCARMAHATLVALHHQIRSKGPVPGFTLYVIDGLAQRDAFLAAYPGLADGVRQGARDRSGVWIPDGAQLVLWCAGDELERTLVEQAALWLLARNYRIVERPAWIPSGFGAYAQSLLLGSYDELIGKGPRSRRRGTAEKSSWQRLVDRLPERDEFDFAALLESSGGSMTQRDRIESMVLTRYLLEAFPERVNELLLRSRTAGSAVLPFEHILGRSTGEFEARVLRWAREIEPDARATASLATR